MSPTRAAIAQAVLEGVAFAFRDGMDALLAERRQNRVDHGDRRRRALALLGQDLELGAAPPVDLSRQRRRRARLSAPRAWRAWARRTRSIEDVCTPPPILHVAEPDDRLADLYVATIARFRGLYQNLKDSFRETAS